MKRILFGIILCLLLIIIAAKIMWTLSQTNGSDSKSISKNNGRYQSDCWLDIGSNVCVTGNKSSSEHAFAPLIYQNDAYAYSGMSYLHQQKHLVIITSVIHTVPQDLNYGPRSLMTHATRFQQTIHTIKTVREKVPMAYIVLIEGSKLQDKEQHILDLLCDEVIDATELAPYTNGKYKSLAEIKLLLYGLQRIDLNNFSTLSKISGRYYLTDNFKWDMYPLSKALYQCERTNKCNTRYYRIPKKYFKTYIDTLKAAEQDPSIVNGWWDIERYNIFRNFNDAIRLLRYKDHKLGVRGKSASYNEEIEDFTLQE